MRIYINNLNLEILDDIADIFKNYLIKTETNFELYTNEGIYKIEDKNIYLLDVEDKEVSIYENYYNNFTLLLDQSILNKNLVKSVHGENHSFFLIKKNVYKINKNSDINLIITYSSENHEIIPSANDIYFESSKDIDINNYFVKNELIEFLSILN